MSDKTTEPGSLVVLLRALVMLVFLVGLPGVAVLKGSFPELADRLVDRGREVLASLGDRISGARGAENTPHNAPDQPAPAHYTPAQIQSTAPPAQLYLDQRLPGRPDDAFGQRMTAIDTTVPQPPSPQPGSAAREAVALGNGQAQPAAFAAANASVMPEADWRGQEMGPVVPLDPQRAEQLGGALRQLGATYYRLEKWGDDGNLFRFQCKMSVDGDPHVNRYFEATDADANRAIEYVVEDVRRWRRVTTQ